MHGFAICKKTTHDSQNSLFVASVSELANFHIGRALKINYWRRKLGLEMPGAGNQRFRGLLGGLWGEHPEVTDEGPGLE